MVCVCETKYNSLQKIHMPEETCLSTRDEKVEKSQNYCCFRLAGLTCEHVGRVCRCIYIQHVQLVLGGIFVHDMLVPYEHCLPWHKDPPTL